MSVKTSLPSNYVSQRGSRRLYSTGVGYTDSMKIDPAHAEADYDFRKQSEFKKPYDTPNYEAMEYAADLPPGIEFPGFDIPAGAGDAPWKAIFRCSGDCYCPGEASELNLDCSYPVIKVDVGIAGSQYVVSITGKGERITLTTSDNASGAIELLVYMMAPGCYWGDPRRSPITYDDRRGLSGPVLPSEYTEGSQAVGVHNLIVSECSPQECCACSGAESIGYTTLSMECTDTQNLTVEDSAAEADCYEWVATGNVYFMAGGFEYSKVTGLSVTLVAGSVGNCNTAEPSVVYLKCGGQTLDTITITVYCPVGGGVFDEFDVAYYVSYACTSWVIGSTTYWACDYSALNCWLGEIFYNDCETHDPYSCSEYSLLAYCNASGQCNCVSDVRTNYMKEHGCCMPSLGEACD